MVNGLVNLLKKEIQQKIQTPPYCRSIVHKFIRKETNSLAFYVYYKPRYLTNI